MDYAADVGTNGIATMQAQKLDIRTVELGSGLYGMSELQSFLALSGESKDAYRARSWLSVAGTPEHRPRRPDFTFDDLITLFVIRELRRQNVKLGAIRDAHEYLSKKWKTSRPFAREAIKTDGVEVLCDDGWIPGQIESASHGGQQIMRRLIAAQLRDVKYTDGLAASWVPQAGIRVDPSVQFGEPVVEGTRVPTELVAEMVTAHGERKTASRFNITERQVADAVDFERRRETVVSA